MIPNVSVNGSGLVEILTLNKPKLVIPQGFSIISPLELILEGDFTVELETQKWSQIKVDGKNIYLNLKKGKLSSLPGIQSQDYMQNGKFYVLTSERLRDYFRKNIKLNVKGLAWPWYNYKSWEGLVKIYHNWERPNVGTIRITLQDEDGDNILISKWYNEDKKLRKLIKHAHDLWYYYKSEDFVFLTKFDSPLEMDFKYSRQKYFEFPRDYETNLEGKIDTNVHFDKRLLSLFRGQKIMIDDQPYYDLRKAHITGIGQMKMRIKKKSVFLDPDGNPISHHLHLFAEFARITGNLNLTRSDGIKKDYDTSVELSNAFIEVHPRAQLLNVRYQGTLYTGFLDNYPKAKVHL